MSTLDDLCGMNCPPAWIGEHSDTYAYMLAGILSTVMLPSDQDMPEREIRECIERLNELGPDPVSLADQVEQP